MDKLELAWQFQSKQDWTGLTPKELRMALEGAIIAAVYANAPSSQHAECLAYHSDQIEFAMAAMSAAAFPFRDRPELSLQEMNKQYENMTFDNNSKRNCLVGYTNMYFYKYIKNVEIHDLKMIVEVNDNISLKDAVDFFITSMLYPEVIEANPGMLVTYDMIEGVQPSRIQSLSQIGADLQRAYRDNDEPVMFKSIFYLMTNFAGTRYRGVHRALLSIFGVDMAQFREYFYKNVTTIIENEGNIVLGQITS